MGIVFVLLLGEIDLSIGYVSGIGGVVAATLLAPGRQPGGRPAAAHRSRRSAAGAGDRLPAGLLFAKIGVPCFVVTLAGLLAWNGVVLQIIGSRARHHPGQVINRPCQQLHEPHAGAGVLDRRRSSLYVRRQLARRSAPRRRRGLPERSRWR